MGVFEEVIEPLFNEVPLPAFTDEQFEGMSDEEIVEEIALANMVAGDVQKLYEDVKSMTLKEKIVLMNDLRIKLERLKLIKTSIQLRYDALRLNVIPSAMDDDGIPQITIDGVGRVSLTGDMYCSIPKDKKDETWKWLRDNNLGGIIKETVNSSSLKATLKSVILNGKFEIPEGLFKITPFTRASITKTTIKK